MSSVYTISDGGLGGSHRRRRRRGGLRGPGGTCKFGVNKNTGACLKNKRARKKRR